MNNKEDMKKLMESLESMYRDERVELTVLGVRRAILDMQQAMARSTEFDLEAYDEFTKEASRFLYFLERYRTI